MILALTAQAWTRIVSVLVDTGLGSHPLTDDNFEDAVRATAGAVPQPQPGQPHPLLISPVDLDASPARFDTPGTPMVPGIASIPAVPPIRAGQGQRAVHGRPSVPVVP